MYFDFDEVIRSKVKSLPGCLWSSTHSCHYVDDTEENLMVVLRTLREVADIDISALTHREDDSARNGAEAISEVTDGSNPGSSASRTGADPDLPFPRTVRKIVDNDNVGVSDRADRRGSRVNVEFRISEKEGLLVIKFHGWYEPRWIEELRSYGVVRYDKKRKEWLLPWSKLTCDSLADYFAGCGINVKVTKQAVEERLLSERKSAGDEIRSRDLGKEALEGLEMLSWHLEESRYSSRTRESYLAMLEFFFRYFSPLDPADISEDDISRFVYEFIIRLGYSAAYQNQMVSAIKIYYSLAGRGKVHTGSLERPRRSRALPKVFSKEEVSNILNSARNIKHKLLLWIIYSCGLRRSEVTNIRLEDLDRDRSIIHIREGKGGIDRIVPVSAKVWLKVDDYLGSYRPRVYLFEGQSGGRYSSESVYRVFKEAMRRAGIMKDVGVHSLRHSYATHLHENGLDIRYIQELLGHRSTRTTEIYTHVSRRNLIQVRSPIEDLDLK